MPAIHLLSLLLGWDLLTDQATEEDPIYLAWESLELHLQNFLLQYPLALQASSDRFAAYDWIWAEIIALHALELILLLLS